MAKKPSSPSMAFAVAQLEKNPRMPFGDLKAAADKKGLQVVPIIYGRAKKALGLQRRAPVKTGRRVAGRSPVVAVSAAVPAPIPVEKPRRGRPPKAAPTALDGSISRLMEAVQQAEVHRKALEQIQAILDDALHPRRGPGRPRKE